MDLAQGIELSSGRVIELSQDEWDELRRILQPEATTEELKALDDRAN